MVHGVKVTPITRTNVKVIWEPLQAPDFHGDASTGGYNIEYRELTDYTSSIIASSAYPKAELKGISRNRVILEDLAVAKNYEIVVIPFNSQGLGPSSRPVSVYVGEAVPTGAPQNVRGQAVSPTEVRLTWDAPQADQQNGEHRVDIISDFQISTYLRSFELKGREIQIAPNGILLAVVC